MRLLSQDLPLFTIALACVLSAATISDAVAQDQIEDRTKLGQTGMQFLSVSLDARAAAMGDAMAAQEVSSVALFYNPASMANMSSSLHASVGQTRWVGSIDYSQASLAFRPASGQYGTVGFSLLTVSYGDLLGTIRADNEDGFLDTGTFSPSALSAGVGYARSVSDRFSVGGHVKVVRQSMGTSIMGFDDANGRIEQSNTEGAVAVDFGALYRTGFRSLNFAVTARNFSREVTYAEESFELPLTFKIGVSMDVIDLTQLDPEMHSLQVAFDAIHPRDYVEQAQLGAEYTFFNTLALRAGYVFPSDEQGINLGLGLKHALGDIGFGFDYGYSNFGALGNVNRLGLQFSFE